MIKTSLCNSPLMGSQRAIETEFLSRSQPKIVQNTLSRVIYLTKKETQHHFMDIRF